MPRNNKGPVTAPSDLIGRTFRDDKGRRYRFARFFRVGGEEAKKRVQREGERMKANRGIRNYRVREYRNVRVQAYPDGQFTRDTVHAMFTR